MKRKKDANATLSWFVACACRKTLKFALPVRLVSHVDRRAHSYLTGKFSKRKFSYGKVLWIIWLMSRIGRQNKCRTRGQEPKSCFQQSLGPLPSICLNQTLCGSSWSNSRIDSSLPQHCLLPPANVSYLPKEIILIDHARMPQFELFHLMPLLKMV